MEPLTEEERAAVLHTMSMMMAQLSSQEPLKGSHITFIDHLLNAAFRSMSLSYVQRQTLDGVKAKITKYMAL